MQLATLKGVLSRPQILVDCVKTAGSTPREKGAWMLVGADELIGTIGGGQLEFIAIDTARQMLRKDEAKREINVPLGPDIGQCCGGRVTLCLQFVTGEIAQKIQNRLECEQAHFPHVYIMGAGHVGRALAHALALLPLTTIIVDTRADTLFDLPHNIETRLSVLPESIVREAPANSAFIVLTHDHALDFMITREALLRCDASYVGMIGSKTKRAAFVSWFHKQENGQNAKVLMNGLHCPIGAKKVADKRPEIIAALVAAEILVHTQVARTHVAQAQSPQKSGLAHLGEGKNQ